MTPSPTWIGLLESAATICELAGHWFVQSTLLIAAGLLAGRLFASRGPAFASAIYRTTFVAAFLCPIVTWCLAQFGMTLGIATLPELRVSGVELVAMTRLVEAPPAVPVPEKASPITHEPAVAQPDGSDLASSASGPLMSASHDAPAAEHTPDPRANAGFALPPAPFTPEIPRSPEPETSAVPPAPMVEVIEMVPTSVFRPWTAALVGFVAVSWLIITALFLVRLIVAHAHLLRLRRAAHPAPAEQQQLCWEVAQKIGVWPPLVLTSPFIPGPCLAGVFRPAILLPDELPDLPLATVFVHELAHLRRRDCLWNVVRQVVCSVLFFQPLAWRLSRRLEMSAEEVCDDHVVEHGADRGTYADILVSLAERTLLPASSAVVPLVTFRSLLGRRVARILDRTRRLSLSVSLTALALIVAGGLAATLGTGALGPAGRGVPAGTAASEESDTAAAGESEPATAPSDQKAAAGTVADDAPKAVAADENLTLHYRGRIVDPAGQPIEGAKIWLTRWREEKDQDRPAAPAATTAVDGGFDFSTKQTDFRSGIGKRWLSPTMKVSADGFGVASVSSLEFETTGEARPRLDDGDLTEFGGQKAQGNVLQLVRDDVPLSGRLVSTEGRPLPGVRVKVSAVWYNEAGSLVPWEAAAHAQRADYYSLRNTVPLMVGVSRASGIQPATTDADGRFTIRGIGRERIVDLLISGTGFETLQIHARTGRGETVAVPHQWRTTPRKETEVFLANDFVQALAPSQPIVGRVTDAETGSPLAGVKVSAGHIGRFLGTGGKAYVTTTTDNDGHYTLEGLIIGEECHLHVVPPKGTAYLPVGKQAQTASRGPVTADFTLRRGVMVRGRVSESESGEPLKGEVAYYAFLDNPRLAEYPGFAQFDAEYGAEPDAEGRYEIAVPPGPGVLGFLTPDKRFRRGAGTKTVAHRGRESGANGMRSFETVPFYLYTGNKSLVHEIDPAVDATDLSVDLTLAPGATFTGRMLDPEGKVVTGGVMSGIEMVGAWRQISGDSFKVTGYYPDEPRDLCFFQPDRNLAGFYRLSGEAPRELTVTLQPAGSVRGRLMNEDGTAAAQMSLHGNGITYARLGDWDLRYSTDEDGNFLIRGLVPGRKYTVEAREDAYVRGPVFVDLVVSPGEAKDVGKVTLPIQDQVAATEPNNEPAKEKPAAVPDAATPKNEDLTLHYHGRVLTPDGQPAAGAKIFFYYWLHGAAPRADLAPLAVTGADGEFDFSAKTSDFDPLAEAARYNCGIVATADGYGFARGSSLDFETTGEARKRLPQNVLEFLKREHAEQPGVLQLVRDDASLVGQVVTIEGKPVAGARVRLRDVMLRSAAKGGDNLDGWEKEARDPKAGFYSLRNNHVPIEINTWQVPSIVRDVTADAEGRFTMRGIGRERVAELMVSGPGIETSLVKARTRTGETIQIGRFGPREMGRSERLDTVYPHKFTFAAGPSKPISGRITDAETGAPISGVRVSLGQTGTFMGFGKDYIVSITDADGRYRLEGIALDDSESIVVWPAAGSGYVPSGATVKLALDKPAPEKDFQLRKGVSLRGQAIDKATGRPIPGRVQYFARSNNPHLKSYPRLANARISYEARSDAEGRFELAIPPGPGIVTYLAMDHTRYRHGQGADAVSGGTSVGGSFGGKTYKVVPSMLFDQSEIILQEVDPAPGDAEVHVTLPIEAGLDVYGKLVDSQGAPVTGGIIGNAVFAGNWYTHPVRDDTFHVEGYYPDAPRDLFFYNPERDLAGYYHLAGPPPEDLVVQLAPAGAIRGRLVDKQGASLARVELSGEGVPTTHEKPELFLATDDDGNFLIRGLIPGRKYTVEGRGGENYGQLFADVTVEAGQTKNVGDMTLTRPEPKKNSTTIGAGTNTSKSAAAAALFGSKGAQAAGATGGLSTSAAKKQGATGGFQAATKKQASSGTPQSDSPKVTHTFVPDSAVPAKQRGNEPAGEIIRVAGRVRDPSGQAAAGADVIVAGWYWRSSGQRAHVVAAKTDNDGHFTIEYRKSQLPELGESRGWKHANIVATKPGFGPAWISYEDLKAGEEPTLRLVKEEPIEGRVVDLEGKPVAGVQVELLNLRANKADDLSIWIERMREHALASSDRAMTGVAYLAGAQRKTEPTPEQEATPNKILNADVAPLSAKATTDADGRFRLSGMGHDRVASLQLTGGGIVIATLNVVSRPMETIANAGFGIFDRALYGARFEYAAEPSQPIEGVVRDAKTHAPIPRVRVVSDTFAGMGVGGVHSLETVADDEGRYRLVGMPKGEGNKIVALPGDDQPYFVHEFEVPTASGIEPVKCDLELHRGVWISGRVTNSVSGDAASGQLYYVPWPDNPAVRDLPEFQKTPSSGLMFHRHVTDADGNYRLVGMPGRGLVTFRTNDDYPYPPGQGLRAIADLPSQNSFSRVGALLPPTKSSPTAGVEIQPTEQDEEVTANISLIDGLRVSLALTDPDGKPLSGVTARGLWPSDQLHEENEARPTVEVRALWPDEQRRVFLHHTDRKLGKAVLVNASENGAAPIQVKLEPCATITMRLIDGEGQPVQSVVRFEAVGERLQGLYWENTDKDGRLTNSMVPTGCDYEVHCQSQQGGFVTLAKRVSVAPGETVELGEIDVTKKERPEIIRTSAATVGFSNSLAAVGATGGLSTSATSDETQTEAVPEKIVVTGQVLDPDGKPVQGADAALQGHHYNWFNAGPKPDVTKSDSQGNFRIEVSSAQYSKGEPRDWSDRARIVASADGFGMTGIKYSALGADKHAVIRLVPDEPIEGRIVNLEGHAVAGAKIDVFSVTTNDEQDITAWVTALRDGVPFHSSQENGRPHNELTTDNETSRYAATSRFTTDADGRFRIAGIGQNRFVKLNLAGGGVVATDLRVVTLPIATFNMKWYATDNPAAEPIHGAKFQFVAEPSPPIEGVVRDAKTGEPLAGVRVWSESFSGQRVAGDFRLKTVSDAAGRYRLEGMPRGSGNRIAAIPGDEQAYFMREFDVPTAAGLEAVTCDLELHRGVLVTGRVTAQSTGKPLHGRLEYIPHPDNPHITGLPEFNSRGLPGPQWRYETDGQGNYRIVAPPGRGYLGLSVVTEVPAPAHQGLEQIANMPQPAAFSKIVSTLHTPHSQWYTAVRELNIDEQDERAAADFAISSGERVPLQLVDSAGQAIVGAEAYGLWPREQHHVDRELPATVDVVGLRPDEKRRVLLYHKERNLAGAFLVCKQETGEGAVPAKLVPCVTVTGRLIDKDGEPVRFSKLSFHIPGEWNYSLNFPSGVTDEDGRFTVTNIPSGCAWDISTNERSHLTQFVEALEPQPGETIDLGEIDISSDKRPAMKRSVAMLPAAAADESHVIRGRVVGPNDEPIAGARVMSGAAPSVVQTDTEGRFEITLIHRRVPGASESEAKPRQSVLKAAAPGYGMTYAFISETNFGDLRTLKLVPDEPIVGRVIDLEGHPISELNVRLESLAFSQADDPSAWIDQLSRAPNSIGPFLTISRRDLPLSTEATTDANGQFRFEGLGHDRHATLQLSGAGVAAHTIHAVTRIIEPIRVSAPRLTLTRNETYFGAHFQYAAEPSHVIEGIVRDSQSGQPLGGAHVYSQKFSGKLNGANARQVGAVTDRDGHYRLEGMPRGKGNRVIVVPPTDEPYFVREFDVPTAKDFAPIKLDLELRRGVWITGRVRLQQTGTAAKARIYYLPWPDNPTIKDWPEFHNRYLAETFEDHMTDDEGRYRVVGVPGRGLVEVLRVDNVPVPPGQGIDAINDLPSNEEFGEISQLYAPRSESVTAVKEITIASGRELSTLDIELAGGKWLSVELVDSANQPVTGATVWWGLTPRRVENANDRVEIVGLVPREKRWVMAFDAQRNLGAVQQVTWENDWPGPAKMKLEPCSTVEGQLVNKDGEPVRDTKIECDVSMERTSGHTLKPAFTDEHGRFVVNGVLPGGKYRVFASNDVASTRTLADSLSVAAGETINLGEIDISSDKRPEVKRHPMIAAVPAESNTRAGSMPLTFVSTQSENDAPRSENAAANQSHGVKSNTADGDDMAHVRGRIINTDGHPVAGADVAVIAARVSAEVGGFTAQKWEVPAQGKSDMDGYFSFSFPKLSSETHDAAHVIARGPNLGMGYARLKPDEGQSEVELKLSTEEAIRGRIVNIDGQPGAGVPITMQGVIPRSGEEAWTNGVYLSEAKAYPAAWPSLSPTDTDGRFEIHGVPPDYKVYLQVQGTEQFAPQELTLKTGQSPEPSKSDATDRPLVKDSAPGEEIVLALAPAQWFEGTVRYADTGEPAPHAKVSIWASQDEFGSMSSVHGETDDQGRYRINPHPGTRFGVNAFGPAHTPYLNYQTPQNEGIEWRSGERVHNIDVTLPRGVMVRGTIVEAVSEQPIAGAAVQYIPERENNTNVTGNILTGWQDMRPSDASGHFEIVALPGPGRILVHGPGNSYILREIGERELARSQRGGQRNYAHAIEKIDPQKNQESLQVKLSLTRGSTIHGQIVDEQGQPVEDALVVSGLHIRPFWLTWHAYTEPTSGNRFELSGLEADHEYPVYVLEPKRRLGAAVTLKDSDDGCTVVLHPCVEATARFVDTDGSPKQDKYPTLQVVIKPGGFAYNSIAQRMGEMAADADFMANLDRVNYAHGHGTNADGLVTFPALIPGARYQLLGARKGTLSMERDFVAPAAGTIDLGEFKYDEERK